MNRCYFCGNNIWFWQNRFTETEDGKVLKTTHETCMIERLVKEYMDKQEVKRHT